MKNKLPSSMQILNSQKAKLNMFCSFVDPMRWTKLVAEEESQNKTMLG